MSGTADSAGNDRNFETLACPITSKRLSGAGRRRRALDLGSRPLLRGAAFGNSKPGPRSRVNHHLMHLRNAIRRAHSRYLISRFSFLG